MVEYGIPQDAQWGDIDIMERQLGRFIISRICKVTQWGKIVFMVGL